eukprot:526208-Amphidinium_carterae.1
MPRPRVLHCFWHYVLFFWVLLAAIALLRPAALLWLALFSICSVLLINEEQPRVQQGKCSIVRCQRTCMSKGKCGIENEL